MPRTVTTPFIEATESQESGEQFITFLEIDHPNLIDPLRVANDVVDYMYESNRYTGFPFEFELLSDSDRPPVAGIRFQNVNQRIGEIILAMDASPTLKITGLTGSDFGDPETLDGITTRSPIGTPDIEYQASRLQLRNVKGDAVAIEAEVYLWRPTLEPWPGLRATIDRLPALYR